MKSRRPRATSDHPYGVFGVMPQIAVGLVSGGSSPEAAWAEAGVMKYGGEGVSQSQTKVCPRETFVALSQIWRSAAPDRVEEAARRRGERKARGRHAD